MLLVSKCSRIFSTRFWIHYTFLKFLKKSMEKKIGFSKNCGPTSKRNTKSIYLEEVHRQWQRSKIQMLEVYCSSGSQLSHQGEILGMSAMRFGLKLGDPPTVGGRHKLYDVLWVVRPRHIWMSPRCGPWSSWNRLNACKSRQLAAQIAGDRKSECVHLLLCEALFRLQAWRGAGFHAHLEQPEGSEMLAQRELEFAICHSLRVQCDTCTAGHLKHPNSHELLRKRTQVWTTSKIVWRALQQYQCPGNHPHDTIAGSCHPRGSGRISVTKYFELYTVYCIVQQKGLQSHWLQLPSPRASV